MNKVALLLTIALGASACTLYFGPTSREDDDGHSCGQPGSGYDECYSVDAGSASVDAGSGSGCHGYPDAGYPYPDAAVLDGGYNTVDASPYPQIDAGPYVPDAARAR
jgi:hypothetical protein